MAWIMDTYRRKLPGILLEPLRTHYLNVSRHGGAPWPRPYPIPSSYWDAQGYLDINQGDVLF